VVLGVSEPHEVLEREFGAWAGVDHVVACSSGTAALHLALECLRLPAGSRVICPDYTMIACARAITLAGLTPVYVDVLDDDLTIDPEQVEDAAREGASAVLAVALYGRRCRMEAIAEVAAKYGLAVVEDLAEAHGVRPHAAAAAACWSYYRNKIVAGEEGGAVAFRDPVHAALARSLRCLGFTAEHDYRHVPRGHNYRLAPSLACLVIDSLRESRANIAARRRIEAAYDAACPPEWRQPPRDAVWVYDVRIPGLTRERMARIVGRLQDAGTAARHGFAPMTCQEEYRGCGRGDNPRSLLASQEVLYLPCSPGLTGEMAAGKMFLLEHLVREAQS
jgi:dTDP-4-amino-4,6-dideoxygalactose transaminase